MRRTNYDIDDNLRHFSQHCLFVIEKMIQKVNINQKKQTKQNKKMQQFDELKLQSTFSHLGLT